MSGFVSQDGTRVLLSGGSFARVSQDYVRALLAGGSAARVSQDIALVVIQNAALAQVAQDFAFVIATNSCTTVTITGHFVDAANNPIANGTVEIQLNVDARSCSGVNVSASHPIAIILDANGNIPPNTFLWSNSNLTPGAQGQNTVYHIRVFNSQGLLAWQHDYATIPSPVGGGWTFDLSNLTF